MKSIPFYSSLLEKGGNTTEILLYGLVETLSLERGYCFASSEFMAGLLGVKPKTIRNILSDLSKKEWVKVQVNGNKRVSITPLLEIKSAKKSEDKPVEKPVEKSERASRKKDGSVLLTGHKRPFNGTLASGVKQGSDIIFINNLYKENKIKESSEKTKTEQDYNASGVGSLKATPTARPLRKDYKSHEEWVEALYKWNY